MKKQKRVRGKVVRRAPALPQTGRLLDIVYQLRRRCPWDRKQTHRSLIPYLLEEAYETVQAIEEREKSGLREELGDLLLQVVLHAEISDQKGHFSFEDVASGIADKMVRRHPHVFSNAKFGDPKAHQKNWTRLKSQEKPKRGLLDGIPPALPALLLAQRYGEIAASVGFDWGDLPAVYAKVKEELGELEQEISRRTRRKDDLEMELGDLLFTLSNLARHLHVDAEAALRKSARKFSARFSQMEKEQKTNGRSLTDCSAAELEAAWTRAKEI